MSAPQMPYGLQLNQANETSLVLFWHPGDTTDNIDTVRIESYDYLDTDYNTMLDEAVLTSGAQETNNYTYGSGDAGEGVLTDGTSYIFRIRNENADGNSAYEPNSDSPLGTYYFTTLATAAPPSPTLYTGFLFNPTATKTSGYTANYFDWIKCDPSGGGFTIAIPTAVIPVITDNSRYMIGVKNITTSANQILLDATGGELIDGSGTLSMTTSKQAIIIISDGTDWWVT